MNGFICNKLHWNQYTFLKEKETKSKTEKVKLLTIKEEYDMQIN
jgi:hypothetical protein